MRFCFINIFFTKWVLSSRCLLNSNHSSCILINIFQVIYLGSTLVWLLLLCFIISRYSSPARASLSPAWQGHPRRRLHKTRYWCSGPGFYKADWHWWPSHYHKVYQSCCCKQMAYRRQTQNALKPTIGEDLSVWRYVETSWLICMWYQIAKNRVLLTKNRQTK